MSTSESQPLLLDDDLDETKTFIAQNSSILSSLRNKSDESSTSKDFLRPASFFSNIITEEVAEPDIITAVFVVSFDTHKGNILEWSTPSDVELDLVEFKAMPSGAHTIHSDFIYFRSKKLFGLSCFEKMRLDSEAERGARMKSVGIVTSSYTNLFKHMQFLELQVRHQLQTPGEYEQLIEFFNDRQGILPPLTQQPSGETISKIQDNSIPPMKITHPAGCFLQFIRFFGENVFVLWKLMLLRKRILFFSPPPIGVVCYRVYCACCLGKITMNGFNSKPTVPYFYVNIADIEDLETEMTYVACTTEKIFQEKKHLYDVYVDNQVVTSTDRNLNDILKVTKVDKENYQHLLNYRRDYAHQEGLGSIDLPNEEDVYQSFFTQLNDQLFQVLYDASTSQERTLTADHLKAMGLDPCYDRHFVMDLLELYAIDVMLVVDNPCCPI